MSATRTAACDAASQYQGLAAPGSPQPERAFQKSRARPHPRRSLTTIGAKVSESVKKLLSGREIVISTSFQQYKCHK